MDLSLVPLDDLIKEVEERCVSIVIGYMLFENEKDICWFEYGKGTWHQACLLTNILNNEVLNNWNGEMQTLQKINDEEDED